MNKSLPASFNYNNSKHSSSFDCVSSTREVPKTELPFLFFFLLVFFFGIFFECSNKLLFFFFYIFFSSAWQEFEDSFKCVSAGFSPFFFQCNWNEFFFFRFFFKCSKKNLQQVCVRISLRFISVSSTFFSSVKRIKEISIFFQFFSSASTKMYKFHEICVRIYYIYTFFFSVKQCKYNVKSK